MAFGSYGSSMHPDNAFVMAKPQTQRALSVAPCIRDAIKRKEDFSHGTPGHLPGPWVAHLIKARGKTDSRLPSGAR